ncbi:hypothetical protein [Psychrobacillus glaciei]|nr:hypothetical protein [Psychrobacillus glaciei]
MLVLALLVACSKKGKVATYQGESENWRASYDFGESTTSYTIAYISKDKVPETIDYDISLRVSNRKATNSPLDKSGIIYSTKPTTSNESLQLVDGESISIKINWEDKTEKLILTKN